MARTKANKTAYRTDSDPKLVEWPADWDRSKHQPLSVDDFADECQYVYWDYRAKVYRERMQDAEREADLCRRFGSKEQREKASKLAKLREQLEQLKAEIGEDIGEDTLADLLK